MTVGVKFLKSHSIYNAGETAGFTKEDAAALVKSGVAEYPPTAEEKEAAAKKAAAVEKTAAKAKAKAEAEAKAKAEAEGSSSGGN